MAIRKEYNQSWTPYWGNMPNGGSGEIPIASEDTLGGIKVGDGLDIEEDGTLNTDADPYELPIASESTLGGVKVGGNLTINASGVLSAADNSVEKVLSGPLDTRLNSLIQKYGDGAKIFCDYIEYPMLIPNSESGEEYNYGRGYFAINGYVSKVVEGETYGRANVMIVDGLFGSSRHYKIVTDPQSTENGVNIRFTNVEIEIQKQQDNSYNCVISYDKAYLVPKTRTQIEIWSVGYDMSADPVRLEPYSTSDLTLLYKVSNVPAEPLYGVYAKMIDITPALEYNSEYRTFNGKFKSLVTVSADLQTVTWVMNNDAFVPYPKQAKQASGWFLEVAEDLSKFSTRGGGYVLCSTSDAMDKLPNGNGIGGSYDGCGLVRYVNMSDGIVLVPDEV